MKIRVLVFDKPVDAGGLKRPLIRDYTMDHDDDAQRRVLGEQCRNAFEGGQAILTMPEGTR